MRPCCARETWSKFSAHVTGMPSSWVRTNSVAKPRTVLVTGTTINSFRFPITSLRVRIITGRRLSGSRNHARFSQPSESHASGSSSLENSSRPGGVIPYTEASRSDVASIRRTKRSRSPGVRRATSGSRSLAVRGCGMFATEPSLSGDRRLSQASPAHEDGQGEIRPQSAGSPRSLRRPCGRAGRIARRFSTAARSEPGTDRISVWPRTPEQASGNRSLHSCRSAPGMPCRGPWMPGSDLTQARWIASQQAQQVAHWNANRLFARLVLLKGPRPAAEHLAGAALAEAQLLPHLRHFVGAENLVDVGLELLESPIAGQQRLARENGPATLHAPPGQCPTGPLPALVDQYVRSPFVPHRAPALRTGLRLGSRHLPLFHDERMAP